jgi:tetratricopeptide (TPR) repeat protein
VKLDLRLPLLIAVLLGSAFVYHTGRSAPVKPPELSPVEHLKEAERLHAEISATSPPLPEKLVKEASAHYSAALTVSDLRLSAAAHYGRGQLHLLRGDTRAALSDWAQIVTLNPGDFERLRALKTMSDAEHASGMLVEGRAHDRQIVDEFGDSDLTQAMSLIVAAARSRNAPHFPPSTRSR